MPSTGSSIDLIWLRKRTSQLEDRLKKTSQTEMKREKTKTNKQKIQKL